MIISIERFVKTGNGFKERLHIKTFKTLDAKYKFLASKNNDFNLWQETHPSRSSLKQGVYAFAGGNYHNVKSLDACVLAHI